LLLISFVAIPALFPLSALRPVIVFPTECSFVCVDEFSLKATLFLLNQGCEEKIVIISDNAINVAMLSDLYYCFFLQLDS